MSDERLRDLERTWQASGLAADHGALLREHVRVGKLSPVRVQVAAYCGHAGALQATDTNFGTAKDRGTLSDWIVATPRTALGSELCVRAAVLVGCSVIRRARAESSASAAAAASHLRNAAAWCDCPCDTHQEGAAATVDPDATIGAADGVLMICQTAALAAAGPSGPRPKVWRGDFEADLFRAGWFWQKDRVRRAWALRAADWATEVMKVSESELLAAMARWALGHESPVDSL